METLMHTGAQSLNASCLSARGSARNLSPCSTSQCSVQTAQSGFLIRLKALDQRMLRQRFKASTDSVRPFRVRAEQSRSIGDTVREIASDEAVEGPEIVQRDVESKAQELNSDQTESPEVPVAAEMLMKPLLDVLDEEGSIEGGVEKEAAVGIASDSAVEDGQAFFQDVEEEAREVAADLGRSVEDETVILEERAEELEESQVKEAEAVNKEQFHEEGTASGDGELTRAQVKEKLLETAQDGFEVLKWAAEGVVSAGQNARQGLGVAQQALDKRAKSFGIAADETRDVSSQVAEIAQKNFQELHTSASKFGEELQVNIEEKKAADSLKPESERNPLANLNENLAKAAQAGKDFTTRVSERAEDIYSKSAENGESSIKTDYEDERGNEFLKGQVSSEDKDQTTKFDVDEAQPVPSSKKDDSDIGFDE